MEPGVIETLLGWGTIALVVGVPVALGTFGLITMYAERPLEEKYVTGGGLAGGLTSGLDAVFSPTAHEAAAERDRQTRRTAPAPAAGDPPWTIHEGSIRIDI
ncbi:hypothetical protein JF550_10055 [Microbacterium esteraromaticum]|uniref:Uncharacterized protein n=1 Tax=Microbacterium esteraromaticum TaxID=57043 RepID=A0A939DWP2_9MICO|nr:hypothetical protein [Microbacterium esteraromaticum]MBN8206295.1 hypothetical protein [Microbacterium esteraromaticum]MBN8416450.1 hypothetical protein [Microbacterium esteraromaticum]MBN8423191.1 hypothetical protein [Microbacterium esteraromaticum]